MTSDWSRLEAGKMNSLLWLGLCQEEILPL